MHTEIVKESDGLESELVGIEVPDADDVRCSCGESYVDKYDTPKCDVCLKRLCPECEVGNDTHTLCSGCLDKAFIALDFIPLAKDVCMMAKKRDDVFPEYQLGWITGFIETKFKIEGWEIEE